jgi:pimeloyl-ACP methyl ester carboxylesterase
MSDPFLLAAAVGVPAIALLVVALGWISYRGMIHYRMRDEAWLFRAGIESGDIDERLFDLPWIEEDLPSPTGYALRVHALEGSGGKFAVFHHGIGSGWVTMIKYMELFVAEGWTVVAFDSRGHGRSGGGRPSYGYFEKADLKAVADWSFDRFARTRNPGEGGFVAFGESMGAATVLQYAPLDPRLDAVIADCPYSSAIGELDYRLKCAMVPKPFRSLIIRVADAICRRLEGFSLRDADPGRAVLETGVPILFIHGLEDRYVPWRMSVVMAETRRRRLPGAATELLLVPGARHGGSLGADRTRYAETLQAFLGSALAEAGAGGAGR